MSVGFVVGFDSRARLHQLMLLTTVSLLHRCRVAKLMRYSMLFVIDRSLTPAGETPSARLRRSAQPEDRRWVSPSLL